MINMFIFHFSEFQPNIRFTYDIHETHETVLDADIAICNIQLNNNGHVKPTYIHQYAS